MSRDWGTSHYRRKVASELELPPERLDRAIARMQREQEADGYRSLSHNERMKAFASILDIPLTRLALVDGVSSLLPDPKPMEKRSSRPPKKKAAGSVRSAGPKKSARRKKPESTVPVRKYAWEMGPEERAAVAEAKKRAREGDT